MRNRVEMPHNINISQHLRVPHFYFLRVTQQLGLILRYKFPENFLEKPESSELPTHINWFKRPISVSARLSESGPNEILAFTRNNLENIHIQASPTFREINSSDNTVFMRK